MSKTISILGATGSIGRQTLDVAEQLGLTVAALTANSNAERLEDQVRRFRPRLAVLTDEAAAKDLAVRLADTGTKVLGGPEALTEAAVCPEADTVVTAVVGMVGLKPTLAAIRERKRIALANKETLVCAGQLVMDTAEQYGAEIVPVDSEHSAIFQCVQGCRDRGEIRRLILTCSGGPFYGQTAEEVAGKTRADALRHPNWTMGPKITVDCATLMNKGLEVIEAMRLYRLPLGAESPLEPLDLLSCPPLTFARPDRETFPCLRLAEEAAQEGGTACAILNGANEEAVGLFLAEKIGFSDIPRLVAEARAAVTVVRDPSLEDILAADRAARRAVLDLV